MSAFLGLVLLIIPLWKICGRAGYTPALAVAALIPFVGFVVVALVLAFSEWPTAARRRIGFKDAP